MEPLLATGSAYATELLVLRLLDVFHNTSIHIWPRNLRSTRLLIMKPLNFTKALAQAIAINYFA